jgi:ADP-ribose pyrophosphatase YjhB (NUDIX family)
MRKGAEMTEHLKLRACGIALRDEKILLQRAEWDQLWAVPGGSIELGERSDRALAREMREELRIEVRVGQLAYVIENLFEDRGTSFHEFGFYYLMDVLDDHVCAAVGEFKGVECHLFFRWFDLDELTTIDIRPRLLGARLRTLPDGIEFFQVGA